MSDRRRVNHYLIQINDVYFKYVISLEKVLALYQQLYDNKAINDVNGDQKNTSLNLLLVLDDKTVVELRSAYFGTS